jgi:hypothetical protein
LTLLAIIIIQYARRRLALARLLLAGLAAILIIIAAVAPYRSFIDKEYPQRQSAELKLNLLAPKKVDENQDAGSPPGGEAKVVIFSLPVSTSEMAADSILKLQGQMISIDSQSGVHWTSNWTRSGIQLFPEQKRFPLGFVLDHHVFEQIKNSPVKLTVSLLYETYVDDSRRNLTIPEGRFTITEIGGPCEPVPYSWRNLVCLAPLLRRVNLLLTTDLSASTCPLHEKETPAAPGTIARHWEHRQSEAPEFGISPTQPVNLYLAQMNWDPAQQHIGGGLCPGTQVVLSHPRFLYQAQQSMSFENVDLSKYTYGRGTRAELRAITQ